ncbi:DUF4383 domain-containing protein [Paenarthrobacter sp. Z7-10]|uniref:DUF4383 domain-containing protein n=1 Tax=Paenarthrobacter sp. Z7-10 TaxID=2787635 RepID=UPI0022A9141C|nr:DUF4383 domain-containing protein [Paenarthrobacter sp. Z7-10]MCZ2403600.1 DUF4383 domain-containing protein [Paenarthrobacter sp. Z7-10]
MTSASAHTAAGGTRSNVQKAAMLSGIVFILVGLLGFVPGITSHYGEMKFASHESGAMLLGLFQVSILHNIVHLLYGVVGLALASTVGKARSYLIWGGIIYLVLWIYGLIVDQMSMANFVPLNTADNWLHLGLGIVMVALGYFLTRSPRSNTSAAGR